MANMKGKLLKKTMGLIVAVILAMTILPACTQEIQAIPLDSDLYSIEDGIMSISLDHVSELSEIGGWINIERDIPTGGEPVTIHLTIIIIRTSNDQYTIASKKNKKGWWLTYDPEKKLLVSSDGKRKFNIDGSVIGDKPKQSLTIHSYTLRDDDLLVELEK
jgi:hypothetical protein